VKRVWHQGRFREPVHNWLGTCVRCGREHRDMLEVFALNDQLREDRREARRRRGWRVA
jgi:hypothetical protein